MLWDWLGWILRTSKCFTANDSCFLRKIGVFSLSIHICSRSALCSATRKSLFSEARWAWYKSITGTSLCSWKLHREKFHSKPFFLWVGLSIWLQVMTCAERGACYGEMSLSKYAESGDWPSKDHIYVAVICFASSVLGGHRNQLLEQHLLGSHWVTIVRNCTTGWQPKTIYLTAYSIWCWLQLVISHCSSFFDCSWLKHQASYNALWWPLGICVFQADAWTNLHVFSEIMIWKFYQLKMTYVYVHIFWLIIL